MKSKEYWEKRQLAREELSFDKGTQAYEEYVKILKESKKEIDSKIALLYARYQGELKKLGVDKIQASTLLRGTEYKQWRYDIEKYVKEIERLKKTNPVEFRKLSVELETLAYRSRISRLDSLKAGIDYELIQAGEKINNKVTDTLTEVYKDTYTSLTEDLNFKKGVISSSVVKKALENDWSGANYSSRIWSNTDNLAKAIKNEVVIGLNKGLNYRTMSQNIAKKFETSYKNAERLVRTETNHIQNQATLMGYMDAGVVKYQFLAVLDSRTSHTCSDLNGEVFKTEDATEGENYPPMHPHCRSTTVPYEYADIESDTVNETPKEESEEIENLYKDLVKQEPLITNDIKRIIGESDGHLEGLEFRLKSKESLFRKIEKDYIDSDGELSRIEIFKKMNDIIRYTTILDFDSFTEDYNRIKDLILKENYNIIKIGNTWKDGNVYKGINTVIEKNNVKIEMQYHTKESFKLKNGILHKLYEEYRDINTSGKRKKELQQQMKKLSLDIRNPKGVDKI